MKSPLAIIPFVSPVKKPSCLNQERKQTLVVDAVSSFRHPSCTQRDSQTDSTHLKDEMKRKTVRIKCSLECVYVDWFCCGEDLLLYFQACILWNSHIILSVILFWEGHLSLCIVTYFFHSFRMKNVCEFWILSIQSSVCATFKVQFSKVFKVKKLN